MEDFVFGRREIVFSNKGEKDKRRVKEEATNCEEVIGLYTVTPWTRRNLAR